MMIKANKVIFIGKYFIPTLTVVPVGKMNINLINFTLLFFIYYLIFLRFLRKYHQIAICI